MSDKRALLTMIRQVRECDVGVIKNEPIVIQVVALKILKNPIFSDDDICLIETAKNVPPIQQ